MRKHLLITGGAGFIGSNFIEYMLKNSDYAITNIDVLTYAGDLDNTLGFECYPNYRFIQCDISNNNQLKDVFDQSYDCIINFAAESHVDRSIENAHPFLTTNIYGTLNLLEFVLNRKAKKMIQISTDEVYGSLEQNNLPFTEKSSLYPNNPYSASKASADLLVRSFYQTHQLPLIITRCSNNYGPKQHIEKFIPKVITNVLNDQNIPLYGDGQHVRDWLFVVDHCRAIHKVLEHGEIGEIYNIGGGYQRTNEEVISFILDYLGKDKRLIKYVEDRKGHDRRYSINWGKIHKELGWKPEISFVEGLTTTIEWYMNKLTQQK
ncbi:dTDP-glucose 4,6-dehydratase [Alkalihalobacterium chitinilyticum]|uniref:dTDP-glucose 4,6-dehydratase n=1 Tax=Alkalihalobacterium chitinilyticum TaxID=2980103 RepID=A0ABT5VB23_9BACI|nr:dTDP-glucose 4,6-dehydratase [Alkalihalobacterium chitinilyticum]MDE5412676.1 dTDP-glucose 4,6-dehydratase [Alkalihalobacterium chitinilyticum]